ncbi:matrix metalloproteinase-24 [Strongylocentrotus purpuratus]|uniref:Peptidase metallopeptidase domain-containing protein n=1 Tax=Strongylocentrotus purpuratus TaxID=7668 RepID=A0A7M7P9K6_STRPU|nr:matrix metalloproteinase-24 [Strongylocentrotus purpuratus]
MDEETRRLMSYPRCGMPDVIPNGDPGQTRFRRYSDSGDKWDHQEITYRILNFTPDLTEAEVVDSFERAFKVWSDVTPLTFRRVFDVPGDIHIQFSEYDHGDGVAFDGLGGTLAHAYFPGGSIGGDAHFDDSEIFSVFLSDDDKTDLFMVAAHEFGHSLGLGHSSDIHALMAPFYVGYDPGFSLGYDDLHGIQSIYGINSSPRPGDRFIPLRPQPSPPDPEVERCSKSFNAVAFIRNELFLFKGKNFWRMREQGKPLEGYPVEMGQFWHGLPPKVDASYERHDGKIVFLKGSHYWVYEGVDMDPDYPRPLRELGLPADIDGALPWGQTGKTYFFKGDVYYRYDEFDHRMDKGYPKLIKENWLGVPINIDAVFRHYDGYSWNTYFIRHRRYWQFDESRGQVDLGFPRNFGVDWMGCKEEDAKVDQPEGPGQLRAEVTMISSMTTENSSPLTLSHSSLCLCLSISFALLLNRS